MGNKLVILFLVAFVAVASMQMSYAEEEYAAFVGTNCWDNEGVVESGTVSSIINNAGDLVISVFNAYPCYEAYINFTVKHLGIEDSPTIYLTAITIDNSYAGVEMDVVITDLDGDPIPLYTSLSHGEQLEGLVTITMLPDAEEDSSYSFSVDLTFSDVLP